MELCERVAKDFDIGQQKAKEVIKGMCENIKLTLMDTGEVKLPGIGFLRLGDQPAKKGRNPKTGETVDVPAKKKVTFKISNTLKRDVNE
jgi:nucleoid DNA-binding protein